MSGGPRVSLPDRPDPQRRAAAFLIDWLLAVLLSLIPIVGGLLGAGYMLCRDGMNNAVLDRRSLGKRILRLRPVLLSGAPMDLGASIRRNAVLAAPLVLLVVPIVGVVLASLASLVVVIAEIGLVFRSRDGRRYGDRFAGTRVVETGE
jgi:uncharacterized RDD family membrane protein YckC